MYFSGRHFSALHRVYSETFAPVPTEVLEQAIRSGKAPELLQAMDEAVKSNEPIQDWTRFETEQPLPGSI